MKRKISTIIVPEGRRNLDYAKVPVGVGVYDELLEYQELELDELLEPHIQDTLLGIAYEYPHLMHW